MLVVSDLIDPFCPWPSEDLVPPVGERRDAWDLFFELLPTLFPEPALGQPVPTAPHAFGPAVHSAYQALKPMGGKVLASMLTRMLVDRGRGAAPSSSSSST